jgi:DNA polymerase-3 subunit beta
MTIHNGHVFVRTGDIALAVKLIDSQFPPYEQVIPKGNDKVIVMERLPLLEALKRASLMSSETRGIKMAVEKGTCRITSDNPELGEVREEIEVGYAGSLLQIGFNPRYFTELLGQMTSEQVKIELSGELDPALIRPGDADDYLGVVMPMRI